jgi:hypothetical protein
MVWGMSPCEWAVRTEIAWLGEWAGLVKVSGSLSKVTRRD